MILSAFVIMLQILSDKALTTHESIKQTVFGSIEFTLLFFMQPHDGNSKHAKSDNGMYLLDMNEKVAPIDSPYSG